MKRIISIFLTLCMVTLLCGCQVYISGRQDGGTQAQAKQQDAPAAIPDKGAEVDLDAIMVSVRQTIQNDFKPQIGIVLGSGLHALADEVDVVQTIPYEDIPGLPHSTIAGHNGRYILGYLEDVPVILMDGRVHYYEGYSMEEVVTPVRVMAKLGVDSIITSNAVGSLRAEYPVGALVCIEDQISSFVPNVLIGPNDDSLGERFIGMDNAFDRSLRELAHEAADEIGIDLMDGVYLQVPGPTYETKAEAAMYAALGADIVGMSTACEVIALKHMNVKALSFSCITDYCLNVGDVDTTHEEVMKNAEKVSKDFVRLVKTVVRKQHK